MPISPQSARASREAGQQTRRALLDAARRLFGERGLQRVSVAEIATAADAFPSQVTYYFASKEALFVEAACRELLDLGTRMEEAASHAASPEELVSELLRMALDSNAPLAYVEAVLLVHRRPDLAPAVEHALSTLYTQGARALTELMGERGFDLGATPDIQIRLFWANILGIGLEAAASGHLFSLELTEAALLSLFRATPRPG